MGLDVSLYRYDRPRSEVEAIEKQFEEEAEKARAALKLPEGDVKWTDEQWALYKEASDKVAKKLGTDEYGSVTEGLEKIELDSKVYPDHMFKIGYLRSSYNEGGINSILRTRLGRDLYDVFPSEEDDYVREVNWAESLKLARGLRDDFASYLKENGSFKAIQIRFNPFMKPEEYPSSMKEALDLFHTEFLRNKEMVRIAGTPDASSWQKEYGEGQAYSNRSGQFFFGNRTFTVYGLIPAITEGILSGKPEMSAFAIGKFEGGDDDMDFYQKALEITVEMCEWVLSQPNPEKYYLHWSG